MSKPEEPATPSFMSQFLVDFFMRPLTPNPACRSEKDSPGDSKRSRDGHRQHDEQLTVHAKCVLDWGCV